MCYLKMLTRILLSGSLLIPFASHANEGPGTRSGYYPSAQSYDFFEETVNVVPDYDADFDQRYPLLAGNRPFKYRGTGKRFRAYRYHNRPHFHYNYRSHPYHYYRESYPHRDHLGYRYMYGQPYHKQYMSHYEPYYDYYGSHIPAHVLDGGRSRNMHWRRASHGRVPARAVVGSHYGTGVKYICRTTHRNGSYLGKLTNKGCKIIYRGKRMVMVDYRVLVER